MTNTTIQLSKFLSYVLRHDPGSIGLTLDEHGWADVNMLLSQANAAGQSITMDLLQQVIRDNDKQRFALSPDGKMIRANQGHSIKVNLALEDIEPPQQLFHGTATRFLETIRRQGLKPASRHDVHLSVDRETAVKVGSRHGTPAVLIIDSTSMYRDGYTFQCSANGVWLTQQVPAQYILFPDQFPNHQSKQ
ncbi:RNA 2'-phosphotransferase [Chitinivorax sp. B]|uniref:RNA 2'-phosphotransferase n=1 Tax=Chitinivorax sp. B TaxID=2502235 RepID=UPI0010F72EA4|nr:RNA 2'-phosphotransferase [Chitinivorax sp. B]